MLPHRLALETVVVGSRLLGRFAVDSEISTLHELLSVAVAQPGSHEDGLARVQDEGGGIALGIFVDLVAHELVERDVIELRPAVEKELHLHEHRLEERAELDLVRVAARVCVQPGVEGSDKGHAGAVVGELSENEVPGGADAGDSVLGHHGLLERDLYLGLLHGLERDDVVACRVERGAAAVVRVGVCVGGLGSLRRLMHILGKLVKDLNLARVPEAYPRELTLRRLHIRVYNRLVRGGRDDDGAPDEGVRGGGRAVEDRGGPEVGGYYWDGGGVDDCRCFEGQL